MPRSLLVALLASAILLVLVGGEAVRKPPASAEHIAGVTYIGTIAEGGSIKVQVSEDGQRVNAFTIESVLFGNCFFESSPSGPMTIANHDFRGTFSLPLPEVQNATINVNGSFTVRGTAQGKFILVNPECTGGSKTYVWAAAVVSPPAPTPSPSPSPSPIVLNLALGWNNIPYLGANRPIEQALGNCLGSVEAVFVWNAQAQAYAFWFKGAPAGVNTLASLTFVTSVWLNATSACPWQQAFV